MIKDRTERAILAVSLGVAAVPLLAVCTVRNDFWEYCTTKAYGFPMPWYVDHCLCGAGHPAVNPLFCSINLAVWAGTGLLLAWIAGRLRRP